jgi:UDP-N-acetylglucosamine:LPS N-acetylglucosamine transferase
MLGRVLVLSASAGAGHLRAAEAIEKAIHLRGLASEVQHLDVLKYTNKIFRHLYSKAYIDLVNRAPEVLGWLYDHLDDPEKNDPIRLAFDRLNANPFIRFLKRYQPDVAICTHFLPSGIISSLKAEQKVKVLNMVVVTDFDVHAMWFTILVSAGGFGVGPVGNLLQALAQLSYPARVVAVTIFPPLAYKIDTLIDKPGKLARMHQNARTMGRPEAAFAVVERLVSLCRLKIDSSVGAGRHATTGGK